VGGKRDDDPDIEMARSVVKWSKWFATKRAAITLLWAGLAAAAAWVSASAMLVPRVAKLEGGLAEVKGDVAQLKELRARDARADTVSLYMMCKLFERTIPNAISPRECVVVNHPSP
jgi:hypothetical protein